MNRQRSLDINKLDEQSIDQLGVQIGLKITAITDDAAEKVNRLLSIYGMSAKIAISFDKLVKEEGNSKEE